jgi:hypothetical protein
MSAEFPPGPHDFTFRPWPSFDPGPIMPIVLNTLTADQQRNVFLAVIDGEIAKLQASQVALQRIRDVIGGASGQG